MDLVNQVTSECFNAIMRLRELDGASTSPEVVHERLRGFVDAMRDKAQELNLAQRDADDMAYAIVALLDEVAIDQGEPIRGYWMARSLQLHYFQENLAGEGFFQKLQ